MTKTLLLLRHAKSSWDNPRLADFERPLNGRGKADAPRMGDLIRREGLVPDLIISSSAKRALATATAVARTSGFEDEIEATRTLYLADALEYLELLHDVPNSVNTVLMVGHNPDIEELLEDLTGAHERMPTAGLAQIALEIDSWSEISGDVRATLKNIWRPKELTGG